ncbi:hypothetical protein NLI96_g977 [Meripilus lineatus]|uniref:Uncharacterized protein n=1 Tax=Meripilus lineatus TaxID=2056292 RepID=A0AAD5YIU4_9APHY|nr:hypothetical protein NLI96_g977 [Physisporinus lineatus]
MQLGVPQNRYRIYSKTRGLDVVRQLPAEEKEEYFTRAARIREEKHQADMEQYRIEKDAYERRMATDTSSNQPASSLGSQINRSGDEPRSSWAAPPSGNNSFLSSARSPLDVSIDATPTSATQGNPFMGATGQSIVLSSPHRSITTPRVEDVQVQRMRDTFWQTRAEVNSPISDSERAASMYLITGFSPSQQDAGQCNLNSPSSSHGSSSYGSSFSSTTTDFGSSNPSTPSSARGSMGILPPSTAGFSNIGWLGQSDGAMLTDEPAAIDEEKENGYTAQRHAYLYYPADYAEEKQQYMAVDLQRNSHDQQPMDYSVVTGGTGNPSFPEDASGVILPLATENIPMPFRSTNQGSLSLGSQASSSANVFYHNHTDLLLPPTNSTFFDVPLPSPIPTEYVEEKEHYNHTLTHFQEHVHDQQKANYFQTGATTGDPFPEEANGYTVGPGVITDGLPAPFQGRFISQADNSLVLAPRIGAGPSSFGLPSFSRDGPWDSGTNYGIHSSLSPTNLIPSTSSALLSAGIPTGTLQSGQSNGFMSSEVAISDDETPFTVAGEDSSIEMPASLSSLSECVGGHAEHVGAWGNNTHTPEIW